jgi:hypothetical protein
VPLTFGGQGRVELTLAAPKPIPLGLTMANEKDALKRPWHASMLVVWFQVMGDSLPRPLGEALEDIARFVGHAKPATTACYVKRLGRRPEAVAKRATAILDGLCDEHAEVPHRQFPS